LLHQLQQHGQLHHRGQSERKLNDSAAEQERMRKKADTIHEGRTFMPDTSQREVVESVFERNQRREAEINNALKQEAARREDVIRNMHRLRALRVARDEKLHNG
jgi:hypothetical protein